MGWKDWPSWVKGGIVGLIIGIILAYPIGMIFILAMMLISPEVLNNILNFTARLIPFYDKTNSLAATANLGIMIIIVVISICMGIIIAKIKSVNKK